MITSSHIICVAPQLPYPAGTAEPYRLQHPVETNIELNQRPDDYARVWV